MKIVVAPQWKDQGTYKEATDSDAARASQLQVDDANTYIDKDGGGNMTFTDAVTGTKTLAQLAVSGDTAWAAKGDLIVGTANDAAAVLTVGAEDTILMVQSGTPAWVAAAAAGEIVGVAAAAEGSANNFARSDHTHQIQHSIADNHVLTVDDASAADDNMARFTANGIEGITALQTFTTIQSAAIVAKGNLGASPTIDWTAGWFQTGTVDQAATAFAMTDPGANGYYRIMLTNGAASARTFTFAAATNLDHAANWRNSLACTSMAATSGTRILLEFLRYAENKYIGSYVEIGVET